MKLHERHQPMMRAKLLIMGSVAAAVKDHGLTYAELWAILCEISASWAKGAIREERRDG